MSPLASLKNAAQSAWYKAGAVATLATCTLLPGVAQALNKTDLTQDTSNGKKIADVATNVDDAAQVIATLVIQLVSLGGFVVVAISLYTLWRASKDEREKPMSAVVGLFIGGAMAAVGTIMWIMRNTIVGN